MLSARDALNFLSLTAPEVSKADLLQEIRNLNAKLDRNQAEFLKSRRVDAERLEEVQRVQAELLEKAQRDEAVVGDVKKLVEKVLEKRK